MLARCQKQSQRGIAIAGLQSFSSSAKEPSDRLAFSEAEWPAGLVENFGGGVKSESPVNGGGQIRRCRRIDSRVSADLITGTEDGDEIDASLRQAAGQQQALSEPMPPVALAQPHGLLGKIKQSAHLRRGD